jgi:predicted Rossmann fold flavoprotein
MMTYDVAIIGAGGAGMMCALTAGKRGRRVVIIDHARTIGAKIRISGGGRCNFTNLHAGPENYLSQNSHFCKSALSRYTPQDFITLIEKHKIPYHEKKLGQLFCDYSAEDIIEMLLDECKAVGVEFLLNTTVDLIAREDSGFLITTSQDMMHCQSLVVATGGLSIPKIGASCRGYDIARQFSHTIIPTAPALDGFTFSEDVLKRTALLTGIALDSRVSCGGKNFRENILFTHKGLSGPAALQASLYWTPKENITIKLAPDVDLATHFLAKKKSGNTALLRNALQEFFPERFAEAICEWHLPQQKPIADTSDRDIQAMCDGLQRWIIHPSGTVGYNKAEVTRGGVDTRELSSKTMESTLVPGLYFVGEVVDVTGQLGGFNFQWAWASGHAAGESV